MVSLDTSEGQKGKKGKGRACDGNSDDGRTSHPPGSPSQNSEVEASSTHNTDIVVISDDSGDEACHSEEESILTDSSHSGEMYRLSDSSPDSLYPDWPAMAQSPGPVPPVLMPPTFPHQTSEASSDGSGAMRLQPSDRNSSLEPRNPHQRSHTIALETLSHSVSTRAHSVTSRRPASSRPYHYGVTAPNAAPPQSISHASGSQTRASDPPPYSAGPLLARTIEVATQTVLTRKPGPTPAEVEAGGFLATVYYVVTKGRAVGIYGDRGQADALVEEITNGKSKVYKTWPGALNYYRSMYRDGNVVAVFETGGPFDHE